LKIGWHLKYHSYTASISDITWCTTGYFVYGWCRDCIVSEWCLWRADSMVNVLPLALLWRQIVPSYTGSCYYRQKLIGTMQRSYWSRCKGREDEKSYTRGSYCCVCTTAFTCHTRYISFSHALMSSLFLSLIGTYFSRFRFFSFLITLL